MYDLVHFLHIAVGGSLLFARSGGLAYSKRGRFREIAPVVPVEVASQLGAVCSDSARRPTLYRRQWGWVYYRIGHIQVSRRRVRQGEKKVPG